MAGLLDEKGPQRPTNGLMADPLFVLAQQAGLQDHQVLGFLQAYHRAALRKANGGNTQPTNMLAAPMLAKLQRPDMAPVRAWYEQELASRQPPK
jgi:hypothetical protein